MVFSKCNQIFIINLYCYLLAWFFHDLAEYFLLPNRLFHCLHNSHEFGFTQSFVSKNTMLLNFHRDRIRNHRTDSRGRISSAMVQGPSQNHTNLTIERGQNFFFCFLSRASNLFLIIYDEFCVTSCAFAISCDFAISANFV